MKMLFFYLVLFFGSISLMSCIGDEIDLGSVEVDLTPKGNNTIPAQFNLAGLYPVKDYINQTFSYKDALVIESIEDNSVRFEDVLPGNYFIGIIGMNAYKAVQVIGDRSIQIDFFTDMPE